MIKSAPISFHREPLSPRIEMCGDTTLFPVDLPLLFGDEARRLPRLCRAEISTNGEPSASVYFAPVPTGGEPANECPPVLLACALLYRYIAARQQVAFDDVPREVDCCFKDTCGFPIVHVSLVGEDSGGCDFRGVVNPGPNATEKFAVRFSADQLRLLRA